MYVAKINCQSSDAASTFTHSLKETGFAILQQHSVDSDLLSDVYQSWEQFFTTEEKHQFLFNPETQDGYFPYKSENAKDSKVKDLKEFYHFYPWGKCPESLQAKTANLYQQLLELSSQLLGWIEQECPKEVSSQFSTHLSKMIENSPKTMMRILNYPALSGDEERSAIRAAAHEDINLLTCLVASTEPGLQVQDVKGVWHEVDTDPANITVNVGDMLAMCSNNYFPSTTHRVINPEGSNPNKARLSIPMFLHPRSDVVLSDKHTAGSYLQERLKEIGLK